MFDGKLVFPKVVAMRIVSYVFSKIDSPTMVGVIALHIGAQIANNFSEIVSGHRRISSSIYINSEILWLHRSGYPNSQVAQVEAPTLPDFARAKNTAGRLLWS